jgi:hypothetical protein
MSSERIQDMRKAKHEVAMLVYLREGENVYPTTESATTSLLGGTTTANNAGIDEPIAGEEPRGNDGAAGDDEVSRDAVVVSENNAQGNTKRMAVNMVRPWRMFLWTMELLMWKRALRHVRTSLLSRRVQ